MESGEVNQEDGEEDVSHFGEGKGGMEERVSRMEEAVKAEAGEEREGLPGGKSDEEEGESGDLRGEFSRVREGGGKGDREGQ